MSDSPSMMTTKRRGAPMREAIAVAATASVGATIAPSVKATGHDRPTISWATSATPSIVKSTQPTASSEMGLRLAWRSRSDEKNAAEYSSGGRRMTRTSSGGSSSSGAPGRKPSAAPPTTSAIGYGTSTTSASTSSATTATSTPRSSSSISDPAEQRDGHRRRSLPAPHEAHPLAGRGLDVDVAHGQADRLRERLAHRVAMGADLRSLEDQRRVDVHHAQILVGHDAARQPEQVDRVGVAPALVGVGEVQADVAQPGRAEQRVDDRVREHVRVGVAGQAGVMLDAHAPEDQRAARFEAVGVVAEADHVAPTASRRRSRRSKTATSPMPSDSSASSARS